MGNRLGDRTGLLFVVNDTPAVWVSAVVVAALALVGYVLSRTTGLPDFSEHKGDWSYPLGVVSMVGEAMMIAAALLHVARARRRVGDAALG